MTKTRILPEIVFLFQQGPNAVVQCEDGGPWTCGAIEGKVIITIMKDLITHALQRQGDWPPVTRSTSNQHT